MIALRRFFLIVLIGLWGLPASAQLFEPKTYRLANGMQIVVVEDHRAPVVHHMIWYRVGSADEPPRLSGIAHFFEHLMFKGTPNVPSGEFSKRVAAMGGRDNAFTSYDFTAYFQTIAASRLEEVMRMEADRMVNLRLAEADVKSERQVVLEERASRTDNSPAALWGERMMTALHPHHPYGTPIIGWRHEIENLSRADALAWYRRHYAPNNAILIVAGDVRGEEVLRLARRHFGPIASRSVPPRLRPQDPPLLAKHRVDYADEQVRQPAWRRMWRAPSRHAGETRHAVPLMLLADIIGGGSASRLYRELVRDQKIAASVSAFYDDMALDVSSFGIGMVPPPQDNLDAMHAAMEKMERGLDEALARLLRDGVTDEELSRAKTVLLAQTVYARDSLYLATRNLGEGLTTGLTVEEIESLPARIRAVTRDEVNAAARAVLGQEGHVTGWLMPKPTQQAEVKP